MQVRVLRHDPNGTSAIVALEPEKRSDRALAVVVREGDSPEAMVASAAGTTLILRSGATGEGPAWLPGPRAAFMSFIQEIEAAAGGASLCLWPTAQGVVSDIPSLRTFLNAAAERGSGWTFLFDPISLLTPGMLPKAEDHLTRLFETFAEHPARWGTLLSDALVEGEIVKPAPLGTGPLTDLVLKFHRGGDVVLLEEGLEGQLGLLATPAR